MKKCSSWFIYARKTFLKYDLGDIHEQLVNPPEKIQWKATLNSTVIDIGRLALVLHQPFILYWCSDSAIPKSLAVGLTL